MMFGYIYLTINVITEKIYIGKHISSSYDRSYLGSGKILKKAIKKYGKKNFINNILYVVPSTGNYLLDCSKLNDLEKLFIKQYIDYFKKDNLYNISMGGDGGDVFRYSSDLDKLQFSEKMKAINKERCSSDHSRKNISTKLKIFYSNEENSKRVHNKIKESWKKKSAEEIKSYSDMIKNRFKNNPEISIKMSLSRKKPCKIILNGCEASFNSVDELKTYLRTEYNYKPSNTKLKRLLDSEEEFNAFFKNQKSLNGMILKYIKEDVETNPDECKDVGEEISTSSKGKAKEENRP